MKQKINKQGFTLLEIIIVIIIVGVLASLALPRFFSTVEYSRSTEALASISAIRQSMERCYLQADGDYTNCSDFTTDLDIEDPANSPNNHFTYAISGADATGYVITASRTARDGGNVGDTVYITQDAADVTRAGTGAFQGMK